MPNKRKKKRTHKKLTAEEEAAEQVPRCFVLRKGECGRSIKQLVADIRQLMLPNTAPRLRERSQNKLKDYLQVAGQLGISHFIVLNRTSQGTNYLRLSKVPQGPTLTYRIEKFSLISDVQKTARNPLSPSKEYLTSPLMVMNNFSANTQKHASLVTTVWQSIFPSINVQKINVKQCKRVVLLDYDKTNDVVQFRHYLIRVVPHGVNKPIKRLTTRKSELPNLENFADISEYIAANAGGSESDAEDGPESEVSIPSEKAGPLQMAIRLQEIGPRMELKLMKIQEGFCAGDVLYQDSGDNSGTGADASLKPKKKLPGAEGEDAEAEKTKELKRIEQLQPRMPAERKKKAPKPKKKKRKASEDGRAEEGAPPAKRQRNSKNNRGGPSTSFDKSSQKKSYKPNKSE